jgi:peptidyl-prolyl cis-trans isomerase C
METVQVNGHEITQAAIAAETQNHAAASIKDAETDAKRALIVRELLRLEADSRGITPDPKEVEQGRRETGEESRIRLLLEDQVTVPSADAATCQRYYRNNPQKFYSPDLFEASHILLSADAEDKETFGKMLEEAGIILERLKEQPELFETFARERSDCPSADEGGHLGQITTGQTTPEFETFLFALEEGQLCDVPVKTPYGVHIIRLNRKVEGRLLPFDAVCDRITAYLEEVTWHRAVAQYIGILASKAEITGFEFKQGDGPLVQ